MEQQYFVDIRNKYIEQAKAELELLSAIHVPVFQKLSLSCGSIDDAYIKDKIEELKKAGVTKGARILYYMTVTSDHSSVKIRKLVEEQKKKKASNVKLPLLNDASDFDNKVLYVGKTNSNFLSRFSCHLTLKSKATYALHLEHWAKSENIELELWYSIIDIGEIDIKHLEQVENILHHSFRPMLGRSGH